MSDKVSELLNSSFPSRRKFLAGLGLGAGAATIIGCGSNSTAATTAAPTTTATPAATLTDADILNFALNLEYLEAEFYLRAATGSGLTAADIGANPAPTTGGAQVPFTTPAYKAYALEVANDELAHVRFLRKALGSAAVDKPAIDLTASFNAAAVAAGIGSSFNPFGDENSFFVGAFTFEDVGVTAYNGAAPLLTNKDYLTAAAGIMAVEGYHAAEIRTVLAYGDPAFLAAAVKISTLRGAASSAVTSGNGADETAPSSKTIVAADSNSLAYFRSPDQVLHIVYLNATAGIVKSGGFFPNGLNGTITASAS